MLSVRLLVSALLLSALGGILWLDDQRSDALPFVVVAGLLVMRALHEFFVMVRVRTRWMHRVGVGGGGLLIAALWAELLPLEPFASWADGQLSSAAGLLLMLTLVTGTLIAGDPPAGEAPRPMPHTANDLSWIAAGLLFVYAPISYLVRVRMQLPAMVGIPPDEITRAGVMLAIYVVLVTKAMDMGGYLIGKPLGRTKLMPSISPKKSWEGSAGGVVFAIGMALALTPLLPLPLSPGRAAIFALVLAPLSLVGDLAESYVKRWASVKDSDALLPEFGGLLDLIDSLVFCAPASFFLLRLLL